MNITLVDFRKEDFYRIELEIPDARFLLQWAGPKYRFPLTWDQMREKIDEKDARGTAINHLFTVVDCRKDVPVGHVRFSIITSEEKTGTIGNVLVFEEYRKQGYGAAIMKKIVEFGFGRQQMNELRLNVFEFNVSAIRCYLDAGFEKYEYVDNAAEIDGEYWNLIRMRMLKNDDDGMKDVREPHI